MCVTLAGRVRTVDLEGVAEVEIGARLVRVSTVLCPDVEDGQWVSVATGLILRRVSAREARQISSLVRGTRAGKGARDDHA